MAAIATALTAYSSATGVSTATFLTSINSQGTADTGLTAQELAIAVAIGTAMGSTSASNTIHTSTGMSAATDTRTLFTALASVLTAFSSATSNTTSNMATYLTSMINIDTGLTAQEVNLINVFEAALGSVTPSTTTHATV